MGATMGKSGGNLLDSLPTTQGTLHVVMLGLDSAGKTTALYRLKFDQYLNTVPTIGFNCEKVRGAVGKAKGVQFLVWDVGGQEKLRPLWRSYTRCTDGIVFVVDSVDVERMEEAKMELMRTAKCPDNQGVPVLILANKQDLPGAREPKELEKLLGLHELSPLNPIPIPTSISLTSTSSSSKLLQSQQKDQDISIHQHHQHDSSEKDQNGGGNSNLIGTGTGTGTITTNTPSTTLSSNTVTNTITAATTTTTTTTTNNTTTNIGLGGISGSSTLTGTTTAQQSAQSSSISSSNTGSSSTSSTLASGGSNNSGSGGGGGGVGGGSGGSGSGSGGTSSSSSSTICQQTTTVTPVTSLHQQPFKGWYIQPACAITGEGLQEGLEALYDMIMKKRKLNKTNKKKRIKFKRKW